MTLFPDSEGVKTKSEAIQSLLNTKIDFVGRQAEFSYRLDDIVEDRYFFGKIGKQTLKTHSLKLNDNFIDKKEEEWPYRQLIIDTDEKVQLVAFERSQKNDYNKPYYVLERLSEHLNKNLPEMGWHIAFEPVFDEKIFWEIINRHRGEIRQLKFVYHVPNLFGVNSSLEEELDDAKRNFAAQKVETSLTNDDGNLLIPETKFVQESIDHISKGGGKYEIKLANRTTITNKSEAKVVQIQQAKISTNNFAELHEIIKKLFG